MASLDRVQCNEDHSLFYGVKLCGREFIRAVIFTCGGSRWRRSVEDSGKKASAGLIKVYLLYATWNIKRFTIPL